MFSELLRQRLEQLNRGPLASAPGNESLSPVPNLVQFKPGPAQLPLEGRDQINRWGPHLWIERPLQSIWAASPESLERARHRWSDAVLPPPAKPQDRLHLELVEFQRVFPGKVMLLDLETCGLAGSCIFLAGLLFCDDQGWKLVQLWARNYAEEKALLQSLWEIASQQDVLVTFNGKSFDWPQVHDRSTLHHLGDDPRFGASTSRPANLGAERFCHGLERGVPRPGLVHLDLLHHARRCWKHALPNCKLQTLERHLCGRLRVEDIPGRMIPMAYHHYVRTGDTRDVRRILHHNELDLLTLLQITVCLFDKLMALEAA